MTFNGYAMFGRVFECITSENPRDEQKIAIGGVNGVGSLDMGDRGRVTSVKGLLYGDLAGLIASDLFFRQAKDGRYYTLVDTLGRTWVHVKLHRYVPQGRVISDIWYGLVQHYDCEFIHSGG